MKDFKYNEMMVHVALCTNKNPQNVLIISADGSAMVKEVEKHTDIACKVITSDIDALRSEDENAYDVVISELDSDAVALAHINRVLQEDGLVVTTHPSLDVVEANKELLGNLGKYAKVVMPFNIGNGETALLATKEYHPTADIILQRSDMLDNLDYYNCDVHVGAFAMGNNVKRDYLGIIKN